jgi:hypothetical protein
VIDSLVTPQLLYIFVHYHIIIVCINTKTIREVKTQKWAGEEEHGQDLGREEGLSATFRPGKDQAGDTEEARAGIRMNLTNRLFRQ